MTKQELLQRIAGVFLWIWESLQEIGGSFQHSKTLGIKHQFSKNLEIHPELSFTKLTKKKEKKTHILINPVMLHLLQIHCWAANKSQPIKSSLNVQVKHHLLCCL